jgi:deoxyribodipyrimidine photo-lyase
MDTIQKLGSDARVVIGRPGHLDPDGRCVVYWMRCSIRAEDNPSLDTAIQAANALGKPIVVFFALVPVLNANLRHYTFLMEALVDIPDALRKKNAGFVLRRYPDHSIAKFCSEVRPALLVTDENSLRGPERGNRI